jgi:toxin ParE1/3/4
VTYRIVITESARDDLNDIGEFIRVSAGNLTSERFIERIIEKIQTLSFAPQRTPMRQDLRAELRVIHLEKYLVFYRIAENTVLILRVVHGARNITADMFSS